MESVVMAGAVAAFGLSVALTWLARAAGRRANMLDSPGGAGHEKAALRRVPNTGGIAIFLSVAGPIAVGLGAVWLAPGLVGSIGGVEAHLPGIRERTPMALALLGALLALHATGLIDDRRALPAWPKLAVMAAAALTLVVGFDVRLLELLDARVGGPWLSIALTVLWFLAVTNAMNFMDNMDGVAAGVGAVAGSLFLITAMAHGQWFVGVVLALLVGALLGFLVFNKPRATIFMGDSGSLVVGFLLAFLTVRATYFEEGGGAGGAWSSWAVFMPLCVLAAPLYDLCTVTAIRLSQGRSPFVGDQQHFTHRLRARGLSDARVLAVVCGLTAVTGISGVLLGRLGGLGAALAAGQVGLVLATLALFEHGARSR